MEQEREAHTTSARFFALWEYLPLFQTHSFVTLKHVCQWPSGTLPAFSTSDLLEEEKNVLYYIAQEGCMQAHCSALAAWLGPVGHGVLMSNIGADLSLAFLCVSKIVIPSSA